VTEATRSGETDDERWDRNFTDLLQEVRVAQTGVQILFAFLLTLPFSARFGETKAHHHVIYVVTLLAAAGASALLITPVSYHRMVFRRGRKPELVRDASRLALAGLVCLLIAIAGAVFVVLDIVIGTTGATIAAAGVAAFSALLWFALPLTRRASDRPT
jgi:hypothetical protein